MSPTRLALLIGGVFLFAAIAAAQTPAEEGAAASFQGHAKPPSEGDDALLSAECPGSCFDDTCNPSPRWSVEAEYLLWWLREGRAPPLLTTGPAASGGNLGNPSTTTLYGNDRLETRHDDRFNGVRLTAAFWLDDQQTLGLEGRAFFLERDSTYFKATSTGDVLLARPYFNALTGSPASQIIAGPSPMGDLSGGFVGYSRVEFFGQEANLTAALIDGPAFRLDLLAGARFLEMRDRADYTSSSRLLPDQTTLFGTEDHFRTHDFFYGGQLGLRGQYNQGRWFLNWRGTAALGGDDQQVRAFGDHLFQTPTERIDLPGGLLVQPSNTGTFGRTVLNGVYEAGGNVGCQLRSWCRIYAGYTLLVWNSPIRAADQVDLALNLSQTAGSAHPVIPFREDLFWAQGVNAGLQFSW